MFWKALLIAAAGLVPFCRPLPAQNANDLPPVIQPHRPLKPVAKTQSAAGPTSILMVDCDISCTWTLDGKSQGSIGTGTPATVHVMPGDHIVVAKSLDEADRVRKVITLEQNRQSVVEIELEPNREARLKSVQTQRNTAQASQQAELARQQQQRDQAHQRAAMLQEDSSDTQDATALHYRAVNLALQQRYVEAATLHQQACNQGSVESCRDLGVMYEQGHGVGRNRVYALELYQKACAGGDQTGCIFARALR